MYLDFHSLIKSVVAKFDGAKRTSAWQRALVCAAALVLLASFLWLAPRQVRQDSPSAVHQSMPLQGGDRTAEETAQPTIQPLAAPTPEVSSLPSVPASQSPERPHISATSEAPTEVLDTQTMQGFVTRLETAKSNAEEHLDTRAMDRLLASLASADKSGVPASPRSKVAKKRDTRVLPRTGDRWAPGSVSPPRDDSVPLSSAAGMQFPAASR